MAKVGRSSPTSPSARSNDGRHPTRLPVGVTDGRAPYTRTVRPTCEQLIARGIPVTYKDGLCDLCGIDARSEKALLCRRRRIELREAGMRETELRAVLPRWRRDGLTPPEMADRLRVPVWRVLDALRALVHREN